MDTEHFHNDGTYRRKIPLLCPNYFYYRSFSGHLGHIEIFYSHMSRFFHFPGYSKAIFFYMSHLLFSLIKKNKNRDIYNKFFSICPIRLIIIYCTKNKEFACELFAHGGVAKQLIFSPRAAHPQQPFLTS